MGHFRTAVLNKLLMIPRLIFGINGSFMRLVTGALPLLSGNLPIMKNTLLAGITAILAVCTSFGAPEAIPASPEDYTPGWHNWKTGYGEPTAQEGPHGAPEFKDNGAILVPDTSLSKEKAAGESSHTNHSILFLADTTTGSPSGLTPAEVRTVYNLPSTGGSGIIAIVDAYHYPTALNDFNVFANEFGLPTETSTSATSSSNKVFQVVYANGRQPSTDGGWSQEAALDIEWAHAMAPNAKIVLVEAASSSLADLFQAIQVASKISGVKQISLSWGTSEFRSQTSYDSYFQSQTTTKSSTPGRNGMPGAPGMLNKGATTTTSSSGSTGIVYFAASGDTGGVVIYPGSSPYVVSAGGTTLNYDANGNFLSETGWSGSGGGKSAFEAIPSYQSALKAKLGSYRGVPDYSFVANPYSGVSVYDSTAYNGMSGWMVFGGTSVSSPALAGIVNTAATVSGTFAASSVAELTKIYGNLGTSAFRDITSGTAGTFSCSTGWDFVTGVGSNQGLNGK